MKILFNKLGCVAAVNLDGGGSTTMWEQWQVVNNPSDNKTFDNHGERPVANAVVVIPINGDTK